MTSPRTILITGATDGIGELTARALVERGHEVLLHGRSSSKLNALQRDLGSATRTYLADLSDLEQVSGMAQRILEQEEHLDVVINNAGVFKTSAPPTALPTDLRFIVNTLAPYQLTRDLLGLIGEAGRVLNLSSAAQRPVNLEALSGRVRLDDFEAYAQSKLALTMWSCHVGRTQMRQGPLLLAINPGSMLGTNMVKQGFGVHGKDANIGAQILVSAALDEHFTRHPGEYFDNDSGRFARPHPDALDPRKCEEVIAQIDVMCC